MAYVSGASLQPIVNRLNSAEPYHPLEANTFADWSLEAGDTVTVSRDGTSYASPVHTSKLTWKKQAQVAISSTGNETRESISKLSSQRYRSGNSGLRNSHYQHIYVNDLYDQMTSGLELTGSTASLYVQNLYDQMKAGLDLTSSTAHLYVSNMYSQMKSGLQLTASSASLYVQSMYDQMKAGLDLTSSSARLYARTIDIEASRVKVTGNTYLNGILSVANGRVKIDGNTLIDGDLLLSTSLSIRTGNDDYTVSAAAIATMIKSASVENNVLTLTRVNGTTVTFSKATSLSGEWSSTNFPLTIKAMQGNTQMASKTIGFTSSCDYHLSVDKNGTPSAFGSSKKLINVPFKIYQTETVGGQQVNSDRYTGSIASVDASSVYNNGSSDVSISDTLSWGTTPSSNISVSSNSVTVSTSGRVNTSGTTSEKTKTINLYTQASTNGLTATFYVTHTDSTDGKRILKKSVTCTASHTPTISSLTYSPTDPGSSYENRGINVDDATEYYKFSASCGGQTKNYKITVNNRSYNERFNDGWYAYYDSEYWEKPKSSNNWTCKIPQRGSYAKETWFTLADLGFTAESHSRVAGGAWAFMQGSSPNSSGYYTHYLWVSTKSSSLTGLSDGSSYYLYK